MFWLLYPPAFLRCPLFIWVWTPEEGQRIQRPKHCVTTNDNKDEDNSLKNHTKYCTSSLISKIQTDKRNWALASIFFDHTCAYFMKITNLSWRMIWNHEFSLKIQFSFASLIFELEYPSSIHIILTTVIYMSLYIMVKVKLVTIVEGDPKIPFSIATTWKCRGGHHSFPWIAPLYP